MSTGNQHIVSNDRDADDKSLEQENQDLQQDQNATDNQSGSHRRRDDETNTSGYGSSQRSGRENVGPLQSDLEQLPSQKRRDRGNLSGPGLG